MSESQTFARHILALDSGSGSVELAVNSLMSADGKPKTHKVQKDDVIQVLLRELSYLSREWA